MIQYQKCKTKENTALSTFTKIPKDAFFSSVQLLATVIFSSSVSYKTNKCA